MDNDLATVDVGNLAENLGTSLFGEGGEFDTSNVEDATILKEEPAGNGDQGETPPTLPTPVESQTTAKTEEEVAAEAAAAAAEKVKDFPSTWTPTLKDKWATVDPEIKAEIAKREGDMFRGIEQYKTDATLGKEVSQLFAPHQALLDQAGMTPAQVTRNLVSAQLTMAQGTPEQKVALIHQLCADYNIVLPGADADASAGVPPAVAALQQQVNTLSSQLQAQQTRQAAEQRQSLQSQVDAFMGDKENFPHAEVLANDIAMLITADKKLTLAQAYEKALWANPVTRIEAQKALATEAAKAAKEAEAEKLRKAQEATRNNLKARPKNAPADTGKGATMDDTLAQTLAAINARG